MFRIKRVVTLSSLLLFVACVPSDHTDLKPLSMVQKSRENRLFQTNLENFVTSPFHKKATKEERNSFIKEFIFQSNIQCQHHLRYPSNSYQKEQEEQDLYMSIFDTVSMIFGVSHLTESAKKALLTQTHESDSYQQEYQSALRPEILKGVELGRNRYAKEMLKRRTLSVKKYGSDALKKDMEKYDKQCDQSYGLIEINRALMALQQNIQKSPTRYCIRKQYPTIFYSRTYRSPLLKQPR